MTHPGRWLLTTYLTVLTFLARDPDHAREERRLLVGSIEYGYQQHRAAGRRPSVAALFTLWAHLGELQPLAVLARLRAANQRAARAGVGGRRAALRLAVLPALVLPAAVWAWGIAALGWTFLGFAIVLLATMLWRARHAGVRWLMPLVPLFMIWPLVEARSAPGRGPAITEAIAFGVLLGIVLGAHQLSRWGPGDARRWRGLATLVVVPLWWTLATSLHAAVYWVVFPHGYAGPTSARLGLPADDALVAINFLHAALLAIYWLALALTIPRVAASVLPSDNPLLKH